MRALIVLSLLGACASVASFTACGGSDAAGSGGSQGSGGNDGSGGSSHYKEGAQSIASATGVVDCAAYKTLAADYTTFVDYLSGPAYGDFHSDNGLSIPPLYNRDNGGTYCYEDCTTKPVDWAGYSGQVVYAGGPGVSRTRFSWSRHAGQGGAQFPHQYLLAPIDQAVSSDSDSWYTSVIDPSVDVAAWKMANGGKELAHPLAIGRGRIDWGNNGVIAFEGGLVGATGSGNSGDAFPFILLDTGKVATDVAVTNNSEFALVTVWDTTACTGQVAVIALTQHQGGLPGLPNEGFLSGMKLLGYVDLPIAAPTRISASDDFGLWMNFSSASAQAELSTQAGRDKWQASADDQHTAAKAGFALIASRDEDKVVVLDLEPLFQYYRSMYMTTADSYAKTTTLGDAPDAWPFAFSVATAATPTIAEVLDVKGPAAVVTGFPVGDRSYTDMDFATKGYVATVDGDLTAYDVGGLAIAGPATKLTVINQLTTCKNPTRVFYGRGGASRDGLVFACRGDRQIQFIDDGGKTQKTLADSRIKDPVAVVLGDSRGAEVVTVADFAGQKVVSYLDGPIDAWGDMIFGGLGADGNAPFELTGMLSFEGPVFALSSAQVP